MGEKKKYKAHILKLVPCILKYLRPIFCPLKTRLKTGAKTQTNSDTRFRVRLRAHNFGRYAPDLFLFWKRNTTFALILGCLEYEGRHGLLFSIHNNSVNLNFQCFLLLNMNDKSNVIWLTPFWNNRQERVKFLNYVRPFFMYFDFDYKTIKSSNFTTKQI